VILHLLQFALATLAIVILSAFYSEADDATALRSVPRRFLRFYLSCLVLGAAVWALGLAF